MKASVALALLAGTCGVVVNSVTGQDNDYSWYDSSGDGSDDYHENDYFPAYVGNFLSGRTHGDARPLSPSYSPAGTTRPALTSLHTIHSYPPSGGSPAPWFPPPQLPSDSLMPVRTPGAGPGPIPPPTTTIQSLLSAFSSSVLPQRRSSSLPLPHQVLNRRDQGKQIGSRSDVISSNELGSGVSSGLEGNLLTGVDGRERAGVLESKIWGFGRQESFSEEDLRPELSTRDETEFEVQSGNEDGDYFYEEDNFIGESTEAIDDEINIYEDVIEENDIILVNRQLEVPYGRVRYLDSENDLKIKVLPGHRCQVMVINNEPLTQRPGKLTPSNFTCNFGLNEVQYTHLGGRHLSEDTVKLLLRYDTHRDTFIVPFTLSTRILYDMQLEVVIKLVPLNVDKLLGISNQIDRGNIVLAFDDSRHECKITLLQKSLGLPRYGTVVSDTGNIFTDYMHTCYKFLESGIRYQHTVESSTKLDYIPAKVELYDKNSMMLLKQEYFQFPVRIHPGRDNTPPSVSFESLLLLDVNQFVMTALTRLVVTAVDRETPAERLIFNVTKPLRRGEGTLVSTADQNVPVASFLQRDVTNLKIAYKPPAEDSNSKRVFEVELEILDDEGLSSPPFKVMIVVNPKMTMAPIATKNDGLELLEGQSRSLSSARNLEIADEDNLADVTLTIIGGLQHGQLLLMGAQTKIFSPADLDTGAVVYQHDHTDTYTDNLLLRMSDTQHEVEFLFPITIFPEDDEPPIAHVNTGLEVRKNEEVVVTPFQLSATDIDSDDANITFILQEPKPRLGMLVLRRPSLPPNPERWQYVNNQYEKSAMVWTQRDITDGFVHYVHRGAQQWAPVIDRVYFKLSDNSEPPNESETMEITVKILPVDDTPPELSSGCSLSLMVHEHELTPLTKENLCYTDLDSKNTSLIYRIQPLHNVDVNDPMSPGSLVLAESPETIVESFTQAQINHHKISFKPPDQEIGIVPRIIQFRFQVEDENRNHLSGQTFTIFLTPVDNQPPEVVNRGLQQVQERSEVIITRQHLDVSDPDTDVDNLVFKVTQLPSHGSLLYSTLALATGNEFTRRDIINKFIRYVNNGKDEMDQDSFNLEVTDGVHTMPIIFFIQIEPIDDEPPQLLEQESNAVGAMVRVLEGKEAFISTNVLRATDPDSDSIRLTFIVQEAPIYGRILLDGVPTSSFTQMSIERKEVTYKHDGGEIGKSSITDNFTLILSDMSDEYIYGGNRLERVMVNITIEPVDNIAPQVFINSAITVDESSKTPITSQHINVSDSDTEDTKLTCVITHQPRNGYVENTSPSPGHQRSRKGIPVTSFSLSDVMLGYLNYVQSVYIKVEPREDQLVFHCTDGVNRSPDVTLHIYIEPYNDEIPELFIKEFIVMEGMDLILEPPVIEATDGDYPKEQLTFTVSRKPKYGRLLQHGPSGFKVIDQFTMGDLNTSSKIMYNHDDSETTEDNFELQLTDGDPEHQVKKDIKVKILPVNDEAPRLAVNTLLEVDIQEATIITNKELMAKDLDSHDQNITYIIRTAPRFGVIEFLEHKTLVRLLDLTSGMTFTQKNIDDGVIQYRHTGIPGVRDALKFDLSDGKNTNSDRIFYINIKGEDNTYPDVVNKGVELPEGGRVALTTEILSTSDLNSPDELLKFTITRMPSKGHLEATNTPGIPLISFTQLQLAGNKVFYIHDSTDEVKMDSFEFVVTDGFNSVFRTFRISISDVDNKKPVLFVGELKVQEGGSKIITPFELKLEDRDTAPSLLRFTVTRIPLHGKLLFNTTSVTRQFTMSDLEANLITYHHDGSETSSDQIHFIATDGTHADFYVYPNTDRVTRKPQRLPVRVQPVDNGVPQLVVNEGASFLAPMGEDGEGPLGFVLSHRVLAVEDRDTPPEALTYRVEVLPRCGQLVTADLHNVSITSFTQARDGRIVSSALEAEVVNIEVGVRMQMSPDGPAQRLPLGLLVHLNNLLNCVNELALCRPTADVNEQDVVYRLGDDAVCDTSDSFSFSVVDRGGNRLELQEFRLEWSWVSLASAAYHVHETSSHLLVTLRRRGYLGHTSFITMELGNETASVTEDLHRSYARQVQFNPGQTSAEWRVRVVDDGVFEGAETLTLTLRRPVMTALEFPFRAFVTISDDEDASRVEFDVEEYKVEEDVGEVEVLLVRHGDASRELVVTCTTHTSSRPGSL
nr:FRAS1-related extracellular matrix protein 2-like [Procambarus clarkii]